MLLTSENTAGSTNTAAENNCNSFILDNNRLSSCRYEIYEPLLLATPPSISNTLLYVENLGYPLLGQYIMPKKFRFDLVNSNLS